MASVSVHMTGPNGMTMQQFGQIIQQRIQWLGETARGSIAACAIQVLRSLRTVTRVAKPNRIKVKLQRVSTLYPSYTTVGKAHKFCLRVKGSGARWSGEEKVRLAHSPTRGMDKTWQVYRFEDFEAKRPTTYLIPSPNKQLAVERAKRIVRGRLIRFAGLARRALSVLMMKTWNKGVSDPVPPRVTKKAYETTSKQEVVSKNAQTEGGTYTLSLRDNLLYAIDAIRGGRGQVDTQMKKAMNKIVSTINHKIPESDVFFGPKKLPTPFPELVRKRSK